ncbi:TetR family transcriptional regulator [Rhodococcus spelaei]|uniref:TetR family transcriptional regulator n=2 Tax=Rhodococcus spelaei TaxID=2546320 RepID=A0A541BMD8_9NOCA|nr:TetR family transcriptional regulator [Rhodococcus spelaei]
MMASSSPGGLRALTREAVRARIADAALVLFDENGFDETTVDDIAAAVGISGRSFFRYFPSKEDAVIGDLVIAGAQLRDNVAERLPEETPWRALHLGMREGAEQADADPTRWLRVMRVINSAASLRARNLEKHLAWSALLVPVIAEHTEPDSRLGDLPARALVASAFACLDVALTSWTEANATVPFGDVLDAAFDTMCGAAAPASPHGS